MDALGCQQCALFCCRGATAGLSAPLKPTKRQLGGNDAVAGDGGSKGVCVEGVAHGLSSARGAKVSGEGAVSGNKTEGDGGASAVHAELEGG